MVADLEAHDALQFQSVSVPDRTHVDLADACRSGHAARAKVRGAFGGVCRVVMFTTYLTTLAGTLSSFSALKAVSRTMMYRPGLLKTDCLQA